MSNVTWNPLDKGANVALSNNNMTAVTTSTNSARATVGKSSGKWYWEIAANVVGYIITGVQDAVASLSQCPGQNVDGWGYYETGQKYNNNNLVAYGATFALNDIIGVALDCDNHTLTFYRNGISQGVAFTNLPASTLLFPAIGAGGSLSCTGTANFGSTLLTYPIPTGYLPYEPNTVYNRIKNSVSSMNIGDYIACRYTVPISGVPGYLSELGTCTATPIPVTGTATPDGLFYLIHCGYDTKDRIKLIPDRNLQTSISWDAINTSGMVNSGTLLQYPNLCNIASGQTSNSNGTVFGNNSGSGKNPIDAFMYGGSTYGGNSLSVLPGNVGFHFNTPRTIIKYSVRGGNTTYYTSGWTFEGSNDGVNYTILDTKSGQDTSTMKDYYIKNSNSYTYYRLNNLAPALANLDYVQMYELIPILKDCNLTLRLPTGGTSATDTDNEWDKIIVNSTLNGTITAGDNNVWNWNGIQGWVSTFCSGVPTRIQVRGGVTVQYDNNMPPSYVSTYGFRPLILVEILVSPITDTLIASPTSTHTSDITVSGNLIDPNSVQLQYCILLNGIQIYPSSGYTSLASSPIALNYVISNALLNVGNNTITINSIDALQVTESKILTLLKVDNVPTGTLSISKTSIHSDNVIINGTLTDSDLDMISYHILLNGTEMYPWTTYANNPVIAYTILNNLLVVGSNTIVVEYKDNVANSSLSTWQQIVTKINATINMQVTNSCLIGTISDIDNDNIQYKILVNGVQKYPTSGYTMFANTPYNINYVINRSDVLLNQNNTITVQTLDSFGGASSQNITFTGSYMGLMFTDINGNLYTSDIGTLIKNLDFGIITSGETTIAKQVIFKNQFGFLVKNVIIGIKNNSPNVTVQLSQTNSPFVPVDTLAYNNTYTINSTDSFYVRLVTTVSTQPLNGTFSLSMNATAISN